MSTADVLKAARTINRARDEDCQKFEGAMVGNIVDAIGRVGALKPAIKAVTTAKNFVGSALTIDAGPRDNLAPWAALRLAQPGDILMIATGGHMEASVAGDLLMGMAKNAGVRAIVTDGVVRDLSGADGVGIPVFAAGISPNSPQKNGPGSVGLPIVIGGVAVQSGDIVCGDEDGVVVVPTGRVDEAASELEAIRTKEAAMEKAVHAGATAPTWLADQPLDDIFTFIDAPAE